MISQCPRPASSAKSVTPGLWRCRLYSARAMALRGYVVLLAGAEEQRPAGRIASVDAGFGSAVEVSCRRLEQWRA